jgi:hypothetical protein
MNVKLVHQMLPVFLHRFDADAEFGRDLFVRGTLGYELLHF